MFKINVLSSNTVKEWRTSKLATEFKKTINTLKSLEEYLNSDRVVNCDASNMLNIIEEKEEDLRLTKINHTIIIEEIIFRINTHGKKVLLFNKEGISKNTYVLPKKDKDDSIVFIVCNNNNLSDVYLSNFEIYTKNDLVDFTIDRKSDGSINWQESNLVYEKVFNFRYDDCRVIKLNKKYGLIDEDGNELIKPEYDEISFNSASFEKVKLGDKWAVMDKEGKLLTDFIYDNIDLIPRTNKKDNDPIIVCIDKKYGAINKSGEIIIPIKFDKINQFYKYNLLELQLEFKSMLCDFSGKTIFPLEECVEITPFTDDLLQIRVNHKSGIYNLKGDRVSKYEYIWIEDFNKDGLAYFCREKDSAENINSKASKKEYGYINKIGKEVSLA